MNGSTGTQCAAAQPVAIIMGSQSDWATMRHAAETLDALGIAHEARIVSAHRTPDRLFAFAKDAETAGFKVIIAGAGGAAHLPGMTAALTPLPVFGVPVESKALSGQDSLLSIVQMPAGIPVGTLAIGRAGRGQRRPARRRRAGPRRAALAERLDAYRARQTGRSPNAPTTSARHEPAAARRQLGILGGGQLARMMALAAAARHRMPYLRARTATAPPSTSARASRSRPMTTRRRSPPSPTRSTSSPMSSRMCPPTTAAFLAARVPVLPGARALAITQDRLSEKTFVTELGLATRRFPRRRRAGDLAAAVADLGRPGVLKTRRFGYDGKGQAMIRPETDLAEAFRAIGRRPPSWRPSCRSSGRFRWSPRAGRRRRRGLRCLRERAPRPYPRLHACAGAG